MKWLSKLSDGEAHPILEKHQSFLLLYSAKKRPKSQDELLSPKGPQTYKNIKIQKIHLFPLLLLLIEDTEVMSSKVPNATNM